MIDHVGFKVSDFQKSKKFYEAALKCLGYKVIMGDDAQKYAGFGGNEGPRFLDQPGNVGPARARCAQRPRIAQRWGISPDAIAAGGRDNGNQVRVPNTRRLTTALSCSNPDGKQRRGGLSRERLTDETERPRREPVS